MTFVLVTVCQLWLFNATANPGSVPWTQIKFPIHAGSQAKRETMVLSVSLSLSSVRNLPPQMFFARHPTSAPKTSGGKEEGEKKRRSKRPKLKDG